MPRYCYYIYFIGCVYALVLLCKNNGKDKCRTCLCFAGKTAAIRCAAVRETGDPIQGHPWNRSDHHSTIVLRGLMGYLNRAPVMPRGPSLSESQCEYLQSGLPLLHGQRNVSTPRHWPILSNVYPTPCVYHSASSTVNHDPNEGPAHTDNRGHCKVIQSLIIMKTLRVYCEYR